MNKLISLIKALIALLFHKQQQVPVEVPVLPLPEPPKYDWDTPELVRHSIRVICDEYNLTWTEKDLICAVIQAESGFNTKATNKNTNGTTDWGLCQINDYWWIGPDKYFKSVDEVMNDPEKSVRFMIEQFKLGHIEYWIAFKNGSYRKYL